jgi:hypothetical protein
MCKKIRAIVLFAAMIAATGWMIGCGEAVKGATTTTTSTTTTTGSVTTTTSSTTTTTILTGPTAPPETAVKLVFVHHSNGENWLADTNGGLGIALRDNNYFVSDTNYGWGGDSLNFGDGPFGDLTDLGFWYDWFRGPHSSTVLAALYDESGENPVDPSNSYSRLSSDPGGENQIIMFKSCFPSTNLFGNPDDPAATGATNPIVGVWAAFDDPTEQPTSYNVANAKWVYNQILEYFRTRPDKLFIAVTYPPRTAGNYVGSNADNARGFFNWMVNDWLDGYSASDGSQNVAVWDFYNVETGPNNHHYYSGGVQHIIAPGSANTAYYPVATDGSDDHVNQTGNIKATNEFVPLLNYYYNVWQASRP